jgi:hypothetical protein
MKKIIKRILIRLKERQEEESPSEKFSTNVFFSKHRFECDDIGYKPYNPLIETHILCRERFRGGCGTY